MKDWLGNEIRPGDLIVYPSRYGSSVNMNFAKILEISSKKTFGIEGPALIVQKIQSNDWSSPPYKKSKLTAFKNITKVG